MLRSSLFTPAKDYRFTGEECKPTEQDSTVYLLTVTIDEPRHTYGFDTQFKNKFVKGAVDGILPQVVTDKEEKTQIVVTFRIGKAFHKAADLLFRETIAQLDQLTLRDKDTLRIEYEKWLDAHGLVSELAMKHSHKGYENHHNGPSMAH